MKSDTQVDLVARCRKGDPRDPDGPYRELYERYKDRVYAICYRTIGNDTEALDASQDTFETIFRGIGAFRGESMLSSWIHRIAKNASIDHLRRRRMRRELSMDVLPLEVSEEALVARHETAPDLHPERLAMLEELRSRVERAFGRLTAKLRAVAKLRYESQLTYEEIGEALGLTMGTVKSRLHRANDALIRELAPAYGPVGDGAR
jgi:RNA polymerase sigma-70 factor (ECF subfamily)